MNRNTDAPLYRTLAEIVALWITAEIGYRIILPLLGISISYNESPVAISLYYGLWALISVITFRDIIVRRINTKQLWLYASICLGFAATAGIFMYWFSSHPPLEGKALVPYTDMLFATPWYFLPKSMEILVQQTLITVLILSLSQKIGSVKNVSLAYAALFGGAHVLGYALSGAPTPYATVMTLAALSSAVTFPYLQMRVRGGFVLTYILHWTFYILLIFTLHTWPPPDYS